jgi:hypothetical protein
MMIFGGFGIRASNVVKDIPHLRGCRVGRYHARSKEMCLLCQRRLNCCRWNSRIDNDPTLRKPARGSLFGRMMDGLARLACRSECGRNITNPPAIPLHPLDSKPRSAARLRRFFCVERLTETKVEDSLPFIHHRIRTLPDRTARGRDADSVQRCTPAPSRMPPTPGRFPTRRGSWCTA